MKLRYLAILLMTSIGLGVGATVDEKPPSPRVRGRASVNSRKSTRRSLYTLVVVAPNSTVIDEGDFDDLDLTYNPKKGTVNLDYDLNGIQDSIYFPKGTVKETDDGNITFSKCEEPPEGVTLPWDIEFKPEQVDAGEGIDDDDWWLTWEYTSRCDSPDTRCPNGNTRSKSSSTDTNSCKKSGTSTDSSYLGAGRRLGNGASVDGGSKKTKGRR